LIKLDESTILTVYVTSQVPYSVKGFSDIQENRSRGHIVIEV